MDLGFNFIMAQLRKDPTPFKDDIAFPKHSKTFDFPEKAYPTVINPCLTLMVSKS